MRWCLPERAFYFACGEFAYWYFRGIILFLPTLLIVERDSAFFYFLYLFQRVDLFIEFLQCASNATYTDSLTCESCSNLAEKHTLAFWFSRRSKRLSLPLSSMRFVVEVVFFVLVCKLCTVSYIVIVLFAFWRWFFVAHLFTSFTTRGSASRLDQKQRHLR